MQWNRRRYRPYTIGVTWWKQAAFYRDSAPSSKSDDAPCSILVQNLLESLRQVQRMVTIAIASSLYLVLGTVTTDSISGSAMPLPLNLPAVERGVAESLAFVAFLVASLLSQSHAHRAVRIADMLNGSPDIRDAALTYPSLATLRFWRRRFAVFALSPTLVVIAIARQGYQAPSGWWDAIGHLVMFLIIVGPIIHTFFILRPLSPSDSASDANNFVD